MHVHAAPVDRRGLRPLLPPPLLAPPCGPLAGHYKKHVCVESSIMSRCCAFSKACMCRQHSTFSLLRRRRSVGGPLSTSPFAGRGLAGLRAGIALHFALQAIAAHTIRRPLVATAALPKSHRPLDDVRSLGVRRQFGERGSRARSTAADAVAGAASVNASKDDCSEPRPSASAECDREFAGPECKACKSDSFGLGCIEPCTVNSCSKHGRCRGWSGQYRRMIARSLVTVLRRSVMGSSLGLNARCVSQTASV